MRLSDGAGALAVLSCCGHSARRNTTASGAATVSAPASRRAPEREDSRAGARAGLCSRLNVRTAKGIATRPNSSATQPSVRSDGCSAGLRRHAIIAAVRMPFMPACRRIDSSSPCARPRATSARGPGAARPRCRARESRRTPASPSSRSRRHSASRRRTYAPDHPLDRGHAAQDDRAGARDEVLREAAEPGAEKAARPSCGRRPSSGGTSVALMPGQALHAPESCMLHLPPTFRAHGRLPLSPPLRSMTW